MYKNLAQLTKDKRKEANPIQQEFALKVGVALTVVRKIEQGKENLSLAKVNQVLYMFGSKLVPASLKEIDE
jgi:DNA-binding XRE family transcriptional regulator